MKTIKKLVLAAIVLPLTFGATSVLASGGKSHHRGMGMDGPCGSNVGGRIMSQLDLTDEQQAALKTMREEHRDEMRGNREEMQAYHAKVQALVLADNFDANAANELAREMSEQSASRRVEMLEKRHNMLSILTPEQKAKYQSLQQEHMDTGMYGESKHHKQ